MTTTSKVPTAGPVHAVRAVTRQFTGCLIAWLPCAVLLLTTIVRSHTPCDADEVDLPSRLPGLVAEFKTASGERVRRVDL